jgi:hypothetical protein
MVAATLLLLPLSMAPVALLQAQSPIERRTDFRKTGIGLEGRRPV